MVGEGIARNHGGDGSGVYYDANAGTLWLSNTILVSHSVGIRVTAGNSATLAATLWGDGAWGNETDWGGDGTILTGTVNLWGDPAFIDPDGGDYRISPTSAAVDAGVESGIADDIDGDPRPAGWGYDLGADETTGLVVTKKAEPDPVQPGAQLTYTLYVTNSSEVTLTTTISNILPPQVTPTGVFTWTTLLPPGGHWTETMIVTVGSGYTGLLTNVVRAAAEEGAVGDYAQVVVVVAPTYRICLPLVLRGGYVIP
jgi:uncharacterized repeat protein (TIGR01451 family)